MDRKKKDTIIRLAGLAGLAALLVVVIWAGRTGPGIPFLEADNETREPHGSVRDGVRVVDYDAFQYGFDPDPLVVRAGERVRLMVKSLDVLHGIVIPEADFETDMPLGERKAAEFNVPESPGTYDIICSIYCGPGHGEMVGDLVVLPRE